METQRLFGECPPSGPPDSKAQKEEEKDVEALMKWIRSDEIGHDAVIRTPFGRRQVLYCDYSASGRALGSIEDYIRHEVLPLYGNTHSSVTVTSEQTTLFLHEARQEVRAMTGAGDNDSVIFTGAGTTAAVELLVHLLNAQNMVVIHSIQEHHSNLLPWRRLAKRCYTVKEDPNGRIDQDDLITVLQSAAKEHPDARLLGAFTACSNVTGVLSNVQNITRILKKFDCLSVWDYASGAPYIDINVNGSSPIDAIFFSGHKFVGGVSSPGVLVIKKSIIRCKEPKRTGGGTVFFVSEAGESYLKDAEYREEGGTPDSVSAIRLALAIKLKRTVGEAVIHSRERSISQRMISRLQGMPNIVLLGAKTHSERTATFSFIVRDSESGLYFHHNYVSALLNDLFGIQSRAGCMCAGPYVQYLLGISVELATTYEKILKEEDGLDRTHLRRVGQYSAREVLRPGLTRLSIPYFWSDQQVELVADCLSFVSERAADFIHLYQVNCESAEWHHQKQRVFHGRNWLGYVSFTRDGLRKDNIKESEHSPATQAHELIRTAETLAQVARDDQITVEIPDGRSALEVETSEGNLRWFLLPIEVVERRRGHVQFPVAPFTPRVYNKIDEDETRTFDLESAKNLTSQKLSEKIEDDEVKQVDDLHDVVIDDVNKQNSGDEVCDPSSSTVECPLDGGDQGNGGMGDLGTDEQPEHIKEQQDWHRRVVVRKIIGLSAEEQAFEPWHNPPLELYKRVTDAIHGLNMIKEGDKVLVCLSGGKDSLSLLHILHFYQMRCRKNKSTNFELGAITVDPGSTAYNPRPLIDYCKRLNIDYFYEEQDIIGLARKLPNVRSICAFCSRLKRGRLAAAAQLHGWNVLAMGQHLDDLVESFFIAAFQNGNLSTMKAQYTTRDSALRVIRPLVFVREKELRRFAETSELPVVAENCPACFNQATERHRIKQLLAQQELVFPDLFNSLRAAIKPLLLVDSACTDEMRGLAIANIVASNKGKTSKHQQ